MPVTLPAQGTGDTTPIVSTQQVTADSSQVQDVQISQVSGGVLTRAGVTSNGLKVDGSAVTQPVSGTITANAGTNLNTSALALDATLSTTNTDIGGLTETAPATDTASSGLNGRLQRIAQRITSLITLLPTSLSNGFFQVSVKETITLPVSGTFWQATQPVSGTVTANAGSGTLATSVADGSDVTLGTKTDAKSTATDTTSVSGISIWKQISASVQAIATSIAGTLTVATHAVTQSGTWTVQPGNTANTTAWKVDASSVAVPVTDNSGSLTVDNSGTFAVQTTLAAGATAIAKAEDVASADADVGVPAMAVRKASPANTSGTDGDYEMLQVSAGRLWTSTVIDTALPAGSAVIGHVIADSGSTTAVTQSTGTNLHTVVDSGTVTTITNVVHVDDNSGSLTVDNGGTFAVQSTIAAGATNIAKAEDVASADADVGVPAMAIRKASPANTSGTDGDYEMLQVSAGRLWTSAVIDTSLPAGSNVIGHVVADSGSTTAVTQATGSNLHAVIDSGTVTTVTTVTTANIAYPTYGTPICGEIQGATSATQLPNIACKWVVFKAEYDNAGSVYIGISGVTKADGTTDTTTGLQLRPGDSTPILEVTNLNLFYKICDNAGDDFTYLGVSG